MSIRIVYEDNKFRPRFFCDHCNQPIVNASTKPDTLLVGNYLFLRARREDGTQYLADDQVFVVHKQCTKPFEIAKGVRPGEYTAGELDVLPIRLLANLGVKVKDAVEHAQDLASIG